MSMKSVNDIFNDSERFKKPFDINDIEKTTVSRALRASGAGLVGSRAEP